MVGLRKTQTKSNAFPCCPKFKRSFAEDLTIARTQPEWLFKNSLGGKIHEGLTLGKLKELFPSVGINGDRRLFWHSFRNFFVIRCLKKGVALPAIMKWTGHDSATMVLYYAEVISSADVYEEFKKVS